MHKYILIASFFILGVNAMAQNILNGQIIDELDFPLENIQVQINQSNIITDVNGEFKIELDKDQNIQIKIEHLIFKLLKLQFLN